MENFNIINITLVLALVVFMAYYFSNMLVFTKHYPTDFLKAMKDGEISKELKKVLNKINDKQRFYMLWFQIRRLKAENIEGDFAELGVYKGESAKYIHLMDSSRNFHLFDTFEGFPDKDLKGETGKAAEYTSKNFANTSLEEVKRYLNSDKFIYYKGYFPETTKDFKAEKLAFVNIDADLYKPTIDALRFFYPKLSKGGVIFVHDYNYKWPGLKKAVKEFSEEIPEVPVVLSDDDSSVLIVKNND